MKTKQLIFSLFTLFLLLSCNYEGNENYNLSLNEERFLIEGINSENYKEYEENPFINVTDQSVSTFSIDADGASYTNMRRFLYYGQTPPTASVRIEEFLNYFTFDYQEPKNGDNVSLNSELATCPWATGHHLLRIGIKGKTIPKNELKSSNYVFLIDVSGSMDSANKLGILKTGFKTMIDNLNDQDRVAIVTYAGQTSVLLQPTFADNKDKIKEAINSLGARGSTAGAQGIETAYKLVEDSFIPNGNNRVILGSDGDFNVGPSSTDELIELIEEKRDSGIFLTVLGVGEGNLNDHMMEQIANKGNGNYEYIDNASQIEKVFINEIGKFYTVAKDAKIQITFNSNKVNSYRLIGYENRSLNTKDFEDDKEDAGEIGSSQTITALYEVILNEKPSDEKLAQFDFRYKKTEETMSNLLSLEINQIPSNIFQSSENMRFASAVVGFGLLMKNSKYKGTINKQLVLDLSKNAVSFDTFKYKEEFIQLITNWVE